MGRAATATCEPSSPGIATNLLAERLRGLEQTGLVDRTEVPPPVARTVYALSELGWRKVPPVLKAIAMFGLDQVQLTDSALDIPQNRGGMDYEE